MSRGVGRLLASAVVVAASCSAAVHAGGNSPGVPPARSGSQQARVSGEYIVTLVAPAEVKSIADLYGRFGIKDIQALGNNVFLVVLAEDPGPAAMEQLRRASAHIKAVEPNFVYGAQGRGIAR